MATTGVTVDRRPGGRTAEVIPNPLRKNRWETSTGPPDPEAEARREREDLLNYSGRMLILICTGIGAWAAGRLGHSSDAGLWIGSFIGTTVLVSIYVLMRRRWEADNGSHSLGSSQP